MNSTGLCIAAASVIAAAAPAGLAQDAPPPPTTPTAQEPAFAPIPPPPSATRPRWSLRGRLDYQFGDEFNTYGGGAAIAVAKRLTDDLRFQARLSYLYVDYDFEKPIANIEDPWDDINTITLASQLTVDIASDWSLFGGGFLTLSNEASIDTDDSIVGGGFAGVTHRADDGLLLGFGLGVADQLQESARFFPVIVLDWEISEELRLTTMDPLAPERTGIELVYKLDDKLSLAFGGAYRFRRFRLDNDGPLRNGVGEDTGWPFWGRMSWEFANDSWLTFHVGVVAAGELDLETDDGAKVEKGYDPQGMVGLSATWRF